AVVNASIAAGGTVVSNGSALHVVATSDVDSNALGSASAVDNLLGVAAGIALNIQDSRMSASIAGNATAQGIEVRTRTSHDGIHATEANSMSGTGIQIAGVAGAVAATLAQGGSDAFIANGASLTLTGGSDLLVAADFTLLNHSDAVPLVDAGTTAGVGAAFGPHAGLFPTQARILHAPVQGAPHVSVPATPPPTTPPAP